MAVFLGKEAGMTGVRTLWLLLCLLVAGCGGGSYTTRTEETGYKGRAKLDAYLAAARFLEQMDHAVLNKPGWPDLEDVSVMIVPASVLTTDAYVREVKDWVSDGGHLICLFENSESYHDDWRGSGSLRYIFDDEAVPKSLDAWLKEQGFTFSTSGTKVEAKRLVVDGTGYEVFAESMLGVDHDGRTRQAMAQSFVGDGIVTVMMDARPFRNRYIGDHDHAELLLALVDMSYYEGTVAIIRDGGLSLWTMLWRHGWPALIGLLVLTVVWLWKNMPRFGPMRREDEPTHQRDYDHHLEALGDFQWRLDKGQAMLRPLRDSVLERAMRHGGQHHGDLFEWMAERAGMTRERAERAMTHERPADLTAFTRVVADLQKLHLSLT
ncbi:hypothetical protein OKA04_16185 [Luteolibacter flavescens]|uniref:DUF4350 domain-containing protein n=1 Tax=Luteolibacter flavescens TaxID=1859460 RepID=A0ABT3FRV5_9BACT|nr:DUF4350 domain-containing protein [Luteolibacter flavescens]MCW1886277.1 hypothetical protein [Luteolibacter flavescens]